MVYALGREGGLQRRQVGLLETVIVQMVHLPELVVDLLGAHVLVQEQVTGQLVKRGGGEVLVQHHSDIVHFVSHA